MISSHKPDEGDVNKPFLLDRNYRADSNIGRYYIF